MQHRTHPPSPVLARNLKPHCHITGMMWYPRIPDARLQEPELSLQAALDCLAPATRTTPLVGDRISRNIKVVVRVIQESSESHRFIMYRKSDLWYEPLLPHPLLLMLMITLRSQPGLLIRLSKAPSPLGSRVSTLSLSSCGRLLSGSGRFVPFESEPESES